MKKVYIPKGVRFFIWLLLSILVVSGFTSLLSAANTAANIIGFVIAFMWVAVSIETKCLININTKKDE